MIGYWNGEKAMFKVVTYEVTEVKESVLNWQNQFIGNTRQGIEITYMKETWIIDNEHGDGYYKVTDGGGSPRCEHKSVYNPINIIYLKNHWNKKLNRQSLLVENKLIWKQHN